MTGAEGALLAAAIAGVFTLLGAWVTSWVQHRILTTTLKHQASEADKEREHRSVLETRARRTTAVEGLIDSLRETHVLLIDLVSELSVLQPHEVSMKKFEDLFVVRSQTGAWAISDSPETIEELTNLDGEIFAMLRNLTEEMKHGEPDTKRYEEEVVSVCEKIGDLIDSLHDQVAAINGISQRAHSVRIV